MITPIKYPYAHHQIEREDIDAVIKTLQSPIAITRGPKVREFEEALASTTGARFAIAFCNASAALWAAMTAAGGTSRDEAVVPTNTFIATATAAINRSCFLRLADVESDSGNIDLAKLGRYIEKRPRNGRRFFLPVHFAGIAVDMKKMSEARLAPSDMVIEDASHAIGSCYPSGEKVGSCAYSDMTVFSFHAVKNITCAEGGAITCNSLELAEALRKLRNSGIVPGSELGTDEKWPWYYEVRSLSCNTHMHDLSAGLGLSQLSRLEKIGEHKNKLMKTYLCEIDPSIKIIHSTACTHYHLAVALIDFSAHKKDRGKLMHQLKEKGIGTQVHYVPLYKHPVIHSYAKYLPPLFEENEKKEAYEGSENYYLRTLSLPLYPRLSPEDIRYIVGSLHQALRVGEIKK